MDPEANLEEQRSIVNELLLLWDKDDGEDIDTQPLHVCRGFVSDDAESAAEIGRAKWPHDLEGEDCEVLPVLHGGKDGPERIQRFQEIRDHAYRLAELQQSLDGWIKGGGFLPKSWREGRRDA